MLLSSIWSKLHFCRICEHNAKFACCSVYYSRRIPYRYFETLVQNFSFRSAVTAMAFAFNSLYYNKRSRKGRDINFQNKYDGGRDECGLRGMCGCESDGRVREEREEKGNDEWERIRQGDPEK